MNRFNITHLTVLQVACVGSGQTPETLGVSKCHLLASDLTLQILGAGHVPGTDKEGATKVRGREKANGFIPEV